MKRVVRHRGQALLLRERAERKAHAPVAPERVLEGREPPGDAVDAVGRRPLTHEEPLRPGHPRPLDRLRADIGDERCEGNAHWADRVARVAPHAQGLLVGDAFDAVMPRRNDETDRARVNVTEDVAADLLIARADVAARAATDAAERVPRERVVAHRGTSVVQEHEVQLLGTVDSDLRLELDIG